MRINRVYGEELPLIGKISPTTCLGYRILRATCRCCGGSVGVRRAYRKTYRSGGRKPKYKDHL